jgi:hypothetical protein
MAAEVFSFLPDIVWYLTQNGKDMWCRVPYGFFFTSREAAAAFAPRMGTAFELSPIGLPSRELISEDGLEAMRNLRVTRIFVDPEIDAATGEVFGRILRIEAEPN